MAKAQSDIDRIRCTPAYSFAEAAHYLKLPYGTLLSWFKGQTYKYNDESRRFRPVIRTDGKPGEDPSLLNLVEAHIDGSIYSRVLRGAMRVAGRILSTRAARFRSTRPTRSG